MTGAAATVVDLIRDGPLPAKQVAVLGSLHRLGQIVPASGWCLIGGLMVEILLISRGVTMLRPTDDAYIVGDVVADRSVLRKLAHGLIDLQFEESLTGWDGQVGVRFHDPSAAVFIDILAPANSQRLRNVLPARPNKAMLHAPGTDFAMQTATDFSVVYDAGVPPLAIRVPSVLGAIYAKASAWHELNNARDPHKHLQDAAALLSVTRLAELRDIPRAIRKRLVRLHEQLHDPNSIGWEYVTAQPRNDAITRLATALHDL